MLFAWAVDIMLRVIDPFLNLLPSGHLNLPNVAQFADTVSAWDYYVPVASVLSALGVWVLGISAYIGMRLFLFVYNLIPGKGT